MSFLITILPLSHCPCSSLKPNCLHTLPHDAGVNVASFSNFNGQRLLTSDQYGQIRVYALPGFYLERSILHPHRQFQHLTPIKAAWHPLQVSGE